MKNIVEISLAAALAACLTTQAAAQTPPPPPCTEEKHAAFDFWLGDWAVFAPDGQKAGDNTVAKEENGCLIVERWTGADGGSGQSYNYFDNETQNWRQVWVSAGATINYEGGLNDAGAMILEGTIAYRDGRTAPFRGTWTPLENGDVRQHFQQYDAQTESWSDWFVGLYRQK